MPKRPKPNRLAEMVGMQFVPPGSVFPPEKLSRVYQVEERHIIEMEVGKIQPKYTIWIEDDWFIGAKSSCIITMDTYLYADNLPDPIQKRLEIEIAAEYKRVSLSDILEADRRF